MIDIPDPTASSASTGKSSELPARRSPLVASTRWGVYVLLIAIAVGNMAGRLFSVNSVDRVALEAYRIKDKVTAFRTSLTDQGVTGDELEKQVAAEDARLHKEMQIQRAFLSANDRSRWMNIRALVEYHKYEIDDIIGQPNWDTIDMVQHLGRDGKVHRYSSKPPLFATLVAGEYWLINRLTGATLVDHPYEIGRTILVTVNILPLILMYVLLASLVERFGTTDWGRIFVMAAATMATFLNTFAITLNNHLIAAVSAAATMYLFVRIICDGERRWHIFFLAGLAAAFTASSELPATALLAAVAGLLAIRAPRETLLAFAPGVAIVAAGFFGTNWIAHNRVFPPYAFRSDSDPNDNWYKFTYEMNGRQVQSYWSNRQGIDVGEPSKWVYALHCLVGHHGVFSLTPVWILSLVGGFMWLASPDLRQKELAFLILSVSAVCLVFFIYLRPLEDRNYGGMTSGFRWVFWLAPLWLIAMIPAADRLARSNFGKAIAVAFLSLSVLSVSYPTWNPWVQPWLYNWMQWCGWL